MRTHITNFPQLLKKWLQYCIKLKKTQAIPNYRITDIKKIETGTILNVHLCRTNTSFRISPQAILADEALFDGFSKNDIRTITYLAYNNDKPKAKIVVQEFCEESNCVVFGIQHPDTHKLIKKSAKEISIDKKLISELRPEEALMVGYILADEGYSKESQSKQAF